MTSTSTVSILAALAPFGTMGAPEAQGRAASLLPRDEDDGGTLTMEELRTGTRADFEAYDDNDDGVIPRQEFREGMFAVADRDDDDVLSEQEIEAFDAVRGFREEVD